MKIKASVLFCFCLFLAFDAANAFFNAVKKISTLAGLQYSDISIKVGNHAITVLNFKVANNQGTVYTSSKLKSYICNNDVNPPCMKLFSNYTEMTFDKNPNFRKVSKSDNKANRVEPISGFFDDEIELQYCCKKKMCFRVANFHNTRGLFSAEIYFSNQFASSYNINFKDLCPIMANVTAEFFISIYLEAKNLFRLSPSDDRIVNLGSGQYANLDLCYHHLRSSNIAATGVKDDTSLNEYFYSCYDGKALLFHFPEEFSSSDYNCMPSKIKQKAFDVTSKEKMWLVVFTYDGTFLFLSFKNCLHVVIDKTGVQQFNQTQLQWHSLGSSQFEYTVLPNAFVLDGLAFGSYTPMAYCGIDPVNRNRIGFYKESLIRKTHQRSRMFDVGILFYVLATDVNRGLKFTMLSDPTKQVIFRPYLSGLFVGYSSDKPQDIIFINMDETVGFFKVSLFKDFEKFRILTIHYLHSSYLFVVDFYGSHSLIYSLIQEPMITQPQLKVEYVTM